MKKALKEKAIQLRKDGWSYSIISQKLDVRKSTLSNWLKEVPYQPNKEVLRRIKLGPVKSGESRSRTRLKNIQRIHGLAKDEIGELSNRDLWMIGLGLYIGEGTKLYETIRFINSDPDVIRLAMKWFRQVCGVEDDNFSIAIHLYPDVSVREAKKYWSAVTKVPIKQFGKTQIDRRKNKSGKKHRKLPYGTVHISVRSRGNPKMGVALHRRIMGWIKAVYKNTRA